MVQAHCLTDEDLMAAAFDEGAPDPAVLRHTADCEPCARRLVGLLQAARGVRLAESGYRPTDPCLDDDQLAALVEGASSPDGHAIAHLAVCARCSGALAALVPLLGDPDIRAAVQEVDPIRSAGRSRTLMRAVIGTATLAAAVLAGVILRPIAAPNVPLTTRDAQHRDGASATEIVPRIVAAGPGAAADTLRWTSVPFADRYQVLMFARDGTLAWEEQTPDTAIALPAQLRGRPASYFWKVEARTDWNRWVASDWAELAVQPRP